MVNLIRKEDLPRCLPVTNRSLVTNRTNRLDRFVGYRQSKTSFGYDTPKVQTATGYMAQVETEHFAECATTKYVLVSNANEDVFGCVVFNAEIVRNAFVNRYGYRYFFAFEN